MKILHEHGFPVPRPIDQARHCILMEFIDAYPLRQVSEVASPGKLYSTLMDIIVRLAHSGLIHGDFNEFNILIRRDTGIPIIIDFPQMVSTSHENAEWYFNRDVECIRTFFKRRFQYESALYPKFRKTISEGKIDGKEDFRLDVVVAASGFGKKEMQILEEYMEAAQGEEESVDDDSEVENDDSEDDDGEEDDDSDELAANTTEDIQSETPTGDPSTSANITYKPTTNVDIDDIEQTFAELELSDPSLRYLSRSPPKSRRSSPDLVTPLPEIPNIKTIVSADLSRTRASQQRKHHSKRSSRNAGRPQGSKAKQDRRVRLDTSGVWE